MSQNLGLAGPVQVNRDFCKRCGYYFEFCPRGVFERPDEITLKGVTPPRINEWAECTMCSLCTLLRPDIAVSIEV